MSFDGVKYTQANGFANTTSKELSGTSLSIEHTLGNGFTITSLTGMRDDEMTFQADIDGQPMTWMDGVFSDDVLSKSPKSCVLPLQLMGLMTLSQDCITSTVSNTLTKI